MESSPAGTMTLNQTVQNSTSNADEEDAQKVGEGEVRDGGIYHAIVSSSPTPISGTYSRKSCSPLHISASQILDFLQRSPLVIRMVNDLRSQSGLPRLH